MLVTPELITQTKSVQAVNAAAVSPNSAPTVATSCSTSKSPGVAISCQNNNNNILSVNCDDHMTPSPTAEILSIENSNSQRHIDDGNVKHSSTPESSSFQRENTVMQGKIVNRNKTSVVMGSCSSILLHTSPISIINNENSNSSNSAISQLIDSDPLESKVPQQAFHDCNTSAGISTNKANNAADCTEKVNGNISATMSFTSTCSSKAVMSSSTSSSLSSVSIKDGAEKHAVHGNLSNVKKEQRSDNAPETSSEGFNTLPSLNCNIDTVAIDDSADHAEGSSCISNLLQHNSSTDGLQVNNNINGNVSHILNSTDYMQQQNHIFVFSTQLANKSAEAVLNGQFSTIIAYHCTQPATKKFLEDFFLKNPTKIAKIQRFPLNMGSHSVAAGHQWTIGANSFGAKSQKVNGGNTDAASGTVNNQSCGTSVEDNMGIRAFSASSVVGFSDPTDSLTNESVFMNWEHTNIGLDEINGSNNGHSIKISESIENTVGLPQTTVSGIASITQLIFNRASMKSATPVSSGDTVQPSLQGVKVPDENLTPQQRQHREEQLAKLKKMNQFLFPEHEELLPNASILQEPNQLPHLNSDITIDTLSVSVSNNLVSNLTDSSTATNGSVVANQPPHIRGSNEIGIGRGSDAAGRTPTILSSGTSSDEGNIQNVIIGRARDISNPHCRNQNTAANTLLTYTQQGLTSGPGDNLGPVGRNTDVINMTVNNCGTRVASNGPVQFTGGYQRGMKNVHQIDVNGMLNTQVEWSKIHNQYYEERVRSGSYIQASHIGSGITDATLSASGATWNVRAQGPPPPYHQIQRSASVPIAMQSPNPSSPNNPTSNLSLPSPRTASGSCNTLNSPISDALVSASSDISPAKAGLAVSTIAAASANPPNLSKAFQREDSLAGSNNINKGNNDLRNSLNQFNSNPNTPLSNISPRDLESLNAISLGGDGKNTRSSPQRSKTPHVCSSGNSESASLESRFPSASPGASISTNIANQSSVSKFSSNSLENVAFGRTSFGRPHDNLPLNPNSGRPLIKQNHNFDPISSLAQMSQQLTNCINSNGGIGGYSCVGISSALPNEMCLGVGVHQNIEGFMGPSNSISSGMNHCGNTSGTSDGVGLPLHIVGGGGNYGASDCLIGGPIINPADPRLLTPKISLGIGAVPHVMRDGPPGFHGGMPPHRMMGRMGVNFCPLSGSPNIQVKASAPNTIQYMPARPLANNITPRVPPSLEFLQRYANPQLSDPDTNYNLMMTSSQIGAITDSHKSANSANANEMQNACADFFQNCSQLGHGSSGPGNINNENQGELIEGEVLANHSDVVRPSNIDNLSSIMNNRGIRSVGQVPLGPGGNQLFGIHRIRAPGSHLLGSQGGMNQLSNNLHQIVECLTSDTAVAFGNGSNASNHIFGQQKATSMREQSNCRNISPPNVINGPVGINDQSTSIQSQTNGLAILGLNNSVPSVSGNGPMVGQTPATLTSLGNYKSYIGQSANDLKYAQQYHNFQQQLYATSTRINVNQMNVGSPMGMLAGGINSNQPTNTNSGYSLSK